MSKPPTRKVGDTNFGTDVKELDASVKALDAKKKDWAASSFAERRELALKMLPLLCAETEGVAKMALEYKGTHENGVGEEMVYWTVCHGFMWDVAETCKWLEKKEEPIKRLKSLGPRADQGIIDVYPLNWFDPFTLPGNRAQLYLKPGETQPISGKTVLERHGGAGELCAILGAGNIPALNIGDVVNKVMLEGCVAVLKLNPVNEYTGPCLERALAPLIERGALRIVYGGATAGKFLVGHPLVDSIHITGSDKTYDAVVWQGQPKVGTPPLTKHVTAELGCVSPVVIAPGQWSDADLRNKALEICKNVATNASCNCIANKVIITSAAWPQREAFLEKIREGFRSLPPRYVYYPGSRQKLEAFRKAYPNAEAIFKGDTLPDGCGPFVLNTGLSPDADEFAFREEPFATVLTEVVLKEEGVPDFLARATDFCNTKLWGTLAATLVIHPREEKAHPEPLEKFLREMRYGAVAVNTAPALAFAMPGAVIGGYPGQTPLDIQSGTGWVRNSLLVENVEKCVLHGSWGMSAQNNSVNYEVLMKGVNIFYRELKKDGHPRWFNIVRMIFGIIVGRYV